MKDIRKKIFEVISAVFFIAVIIGFILLILSDIEYIKIAATLCGGALAFYLFLYGGITVLLWIFDRCPNRRH